MSNHSTENRRSHFIMILLAIIAFIVVLVAVRKCSKRTESLQTITYNITQEPIYFIVQSGGRYEEYLLRQYPELEKLNNHGLGGAKLLGEVFADAYGNHKSTSASDDTITGPKLEKIGIGVDDSDDGLPNQINNGEVSAKPSPISTGGGSSGCYNIFDLNIELENLTRNEKKVEIRQGLLLETNGDDVQNIVILKNVSIYLKAHEKQTVRVLAYCASHHRSSPKGYPVRITPFYLMAEESAFLSQTSIWNWQETMYSSWRHKPTINNTVFGQR